MAGVLGLTVAQGPIYAGTLCECVEELAAKRTCFDALGPVTAVSVTRFVPANQFECTIQKTGPAATLTLQADFQESKSQPQSLNLKCVILTSGAASGCGNAVINNLSRKEQAAWASLIRSECRDALP